MKVGRSRGYIKMRCPYGLQNGVYGGTFATAEIQIAAIVRRADLTCKTRKVAHVVVEKILRLLTGDRNGLPGQILVADGRLLEPCLAHIRSLVETT